MSVFGFPDPVNEKAARAVAGQVLLVAVVTLILSVTAGSGWLWLVAGLAGGFLARVCTGATCSPFGQLATRVLAPRLGQPKLVPGPPKRFAQTMGLTVTTVAVVALATGHPLATQALLVVLVVAAALEAVTSYCVGCAVFTVLMRHGLIPARVCVGCADVARHHRSTLRTKMLP